MTLATIAINGMTFTLVRMNTGMLAQNLFFMVNKPRDWEEFFGKEGRSIAQTQLEIIWHAASYFREDGLKLSILLNTIILIYRGSENSLSSWWGHIWLCGTPRKDRDYNGELNYQCIRASLEGESNEKGEGLIREETPINLEFLRRVDKIYRENYANKKISRKSWDEIGVLAEEINDSVFDGMLGSFKDRSYF